MDYSELTDPEEDKFDMPRPPKESRGNRLVSTPVEVISKLAQKVADVAEHHAQDVITVLGQLDGMTEADALTYIAQAAVQRKWSKATKAAIMAGLDAAKKSSN